MSSIAADIGQALGSAIASNIVGDGEMLRLRQTIALAEQFRGPQAPPPDPEVAKAQALAAVELALEPARASASDRLKLAQERFDKAKADGRDTTSYQATLDAEQAHMLKLL